MAEAADPRRLVRRALVLGRRARSFGRRSSDPPRTAAVHGKARIEFRRDATASFGDGRELRTAVADQEPGALGVAASFERSIRITPQSGRLGGHPEGSGGPSASPMSSSYTQPSGRRLNIWLWW